MSTIEQIRDGITTRLETLDAVRVQQEWGTAPHVSGTAVAAIVEYDGTTYDAAMGGQGDDLTFKVTALASKVSDRAGRAKLDALCDPTRGSVTSLREAVNGSLGSVVAYATVVSNSGYREYAVGEVSYLGCEFAVSVAT